MSVLIITQISQMNQAGKNIISAGKVHHIILESRRIDFYGITGQHFYNGSFESVKIHIDQRHNCFVGSGIRPVALEFIPDH